MAASDNIFERGFDDHSRGIRADGQNKFPLASSKEGGGTCDVQLVDIQEKQNLARGLKQRNVQMIAIAGAIVCI
jgi:amino acid permease